MSPLTLEGEFMRKASVSVWLCLVTLFLGVNFNVQAQTWSFTGNMNYYHASHTATLLNNGEVLIAGGLELGESPINAELYNPSSDSFTVTGNLNTGRYDHAAALLPNGEVLLVGGQATNCASGGLSSAELYNPTAGTFTYTGSLHTGICAPAATLLPNGKVLVVGVSTAELYDPATGTFSVTGAPNITRADYTATLLANGKVLIAGGIGVSNNYLNSAELYDPATGTFTLTGSLHTARAIHAATLLGNGEVLIAGGETYVAPAYQILSTAELYNPATGKFTVTGSMNVARAFLSANSAAIQGAAPLLPSGKVLEPGGFATATAELYDPSTGTFSTTASLNVERDNGQRTVLLSNGSVLVTGGEKYYTYRPRLLNTAEVYH